MKRVVWFSTRLLQVAAVVGIGYLATACAGVSDEQVCAAKGFGPETDAFWTCMNYVQQERAINAQRIAANAAVFGAVKPRTCNAYGNSVQCW